MSAESPITDAVARMMGIGSQCMNKYSGHVSDVNSRMKSGNYRADEAANDLMMCMKVASEGMAMWLEGVSAIVADCYQSHDPVLLLAPPGLTRPVDLTIVEITGAWDDPIASGMSLHPTRLSSSSDTFEVRADSTIPPDLYKLKVRFKPSSGSAAQKTYTTRFP